MTHLLDQNFSFPLPLMAVSDPHIDIKTKQTHRVVFWGVARIVRVVVMV